MENQNDIRGLLQEKFQHHEANPPRDIWAQIEADLNPPQKKKVVLWPYMAVAASALVLFGLWALLGGPQDTPNFPSNDGMAETTPAENVQPQPQEESIPSLTEEKSFAAQQEEEGDANNTEIKPLFQQASTRNFAQQSTTAPVEQPAVQEENQETINSSAAIALNPISPINPTLYPDAPVHQLEDKLPNKVESNSSTAAEVATANTSRLQRVKDNKLDLNEFSLQNVVAFASNELSKIAGSPLDYEHQQGQNAERKRYEFELGDFKITRTSFKKTTNQ